jgi:hypothetical protein
MQYVYQVRALQTRGLFIASSVAAVMVVRHDMLNARAEAQAQAAVLVLCHALLVSLISSDFCAIEPDPSENGRLHVAALLNTQSLPPNIPQPHCRGLRPT